MPAKHLFRIGEVAKLVGVRPHVLRYWEEEFGLLRPMKTRGSHRQYRRRDVEIARLVRQWIEVDGFTVAGARRKLAKLRDTARSKERSLSKDLVAIRDDLLGAMALLDAPVRATSRLELVDDLALEDRRSTAAPPAGSGAMSTHASRTRARLVTPR